MKATLVFSSHESFEISIGMVFIPSIAWISQGKTILIPHGDFPFYKPGDFQGLTATAFYQKLVSNQQIKGNKVCVVAHAETGHGRQEDIDMLVADIKASGFLCEVCYL